MSDFMGKSYKYFLQAHSSRLKANMNSDKPLQTAAIFILTNFYLKQGIGLVYVMVDFICMDFL